MKTSLLVVVLLVIQIPSAYCQDWTWGIKATGDNQQYLGSDIASDAEGNITVAGYFQESFSLGAFSLYTTDDYYADIYLSRINANHQVEWLLQIEAGQSYGDDIAVVLDDDGNIYLSGNKDGYIFVSKYTLKGKLIWTNDFERKHYGYGYGLAIDQFDNVYVGGGSGWTFFMVKLNYDGDTIWKKDFWYNYSAACKLSDLNVDAMGNIYFIGSFGTDIKLDDFSLIHTGSWGEETFWGKMDADGNFIWVKSAIGRTSDNPQLALTADNHIYLSGAYFPGISFDDTYLDGLCCQEASPYLAKYDTKGNLVWAKETFTNWDGEGAVLNDLKTDYAGNVYLTGSYFTCYGTGCTQLDFYIQKCDKNGVHLWRKEMNMGDNDMCNNIDIDNNGFCYAIGDNNSENFIDLHAYSFIHSVGIGKFDTQASTYKRTPRPSDLSRSYWLCDGETKLTLKATGTNVKWYSDATTSTLIHSGNEFQKVLTLTDTFYVTQTVNGIASWPKEIIANVVKLPAADLILKNDTLSAPGIGRTHYQWLYKGDSIDAPSHYVVVDTAANVDDFSVVISQGPCFKILENIVTGIRPEPAKDFSCYPNPTSGIVNVKHMYGLGATFRVLTVQGVEVWRQHDEPTNNNSPVVDISQQPPGIYLLRIQTNNAQQTVKVIKK